MTAGRIAHSAARSPEGMVMRRWLFPDLVGLQVSAGLLVLRLVVGAALVLHGWPKIQNPMGWMPAEAPVPGFLQACSAVAEFGGGIALILGLVTRVAALAVAVNMAVAAAFHIQRGDPFVNLTGGPSFELAAAYFASAVVLFLAGPGRLSLDALAFGGFDLDAAPRPAP
jgi:putative oxidoreductase